jgi:hypothetical protein
MAEDDGLACSPVLIENFDAIFRRNRGHMFLLRETSPRLLFLARVRRFSDQMARPAHRHEMSKDPAATGIEMMIRVK